MCVSITYRHVDTTNWKDFETLFLSKGILSNCWCMAWRITKDELKNNNRVSRKVFIKQRIDSDIPIGLLTYADHEAIV